MRRQDAPQPIDRHSKRGRLGVGELQFDGEHPATLVVEQVNEPCTRSFVHLASGPKPASQAVVRTAKVDSMTFPLAENLLGGRTARGDRHLRDKQLPARDDEPQL